MTDHRQETIDTYNRSAQALADYFRGIGSRIDDINKAFELAGKPKHAKVVEIGCGDGRDAKEIIKRTTNYFGFDISAELIKLARDLVPTAKFVVADAVDFDYPKDLDIVFAFASLLHLNKDEFRQVLGKVHVALKPGGIFYISLKYAPTYEKRIKEDKYGRRVFYFYNSGIVKELTNGDYEFMDMGGKTIGETEWLEVGLRKR